MYTSKIKYEWVLHKKPLSEMLLPFMSRVPTICVFSKTKKNIKSVQLGKSLYTAWAYFRTEMKRPTGSLRKHSQAIYKDFSQP